MNHILTILITSEVLEILHECSYSVICNKTKIGRKNTPVVFVLFPADFSPIASGGQAAGEQGL